MRRDEAKLMMVSEIRFQRIHVTCFPLYVDCRGKEKGFENESVEYGKCTSCACVVMSQ